MHVHAHMSDFTLDGACQPHYYHYYHYYPSLLSLLSLLFLTIITIIPHYYHYYSSLLSLLSLLFLTIIQTCLHESCIAFFRGLTRLCAGPDLGYQADFQAAYASAHTQAEPGSPEERQPSPPPPPPQPVVVSDACIHMHLRVCVHNVHHRSRFI